jgi:hypothetical protein
MSTHRQVIVTGPSTAGKSTFADQLIRKYFLQHIQIDPIIEGFEDVFPELGITHRALSLAAHQTVCENFKPFLFRMIDGLRDDDFVIEGFRMPVEALIEKYRSTHQVVVLGYPRNTPAERLALCRRFDRINWTNALTDGQLLDIFAFFIDESRRLEVLCRQQQVAFFDTSTEYWGTIRAAVDKVSQR